MKNLFLIFAMLTLSIGLKAQDDVQSFEKFTKVEVATSVTVELIKSNEHKAEIWVEDGDLEELKQEQFVNRLKIKWEDRGKIWRGDNYKRKARVKVYYKELNGLAVSAGGKINGDEMIKADDFEMEASSGGQMNIELSASVVDVDVSSGGGIKVEGQTKRLVVDASSGGSFKGSDLKAMDVKANASSGGNARVWATERIDAKASSGGNVKYKGDPKNRDISNSKWSGGSVRPMQVKHKIII